MSVTARQLEDFFAYLRIPSISADPTRSVAMDNCASWLEAKFTAMGFSAVLHKSHDGPPVVVARRMSSPGKKTLLIYGHYDVQPVDPLELWHSDPFSPVIQEGLVVARGATDNKGQTMCHVLGAEELLREAGELPVNLIFLMEGEEEIGSPHFEAFLVKCRDDLRCDAILISDTSMAAPGFPAITSGLRGIACLEVTVEGPSRDLHSGMFGGAVANPATELAKLLAQLHDANGVVAVPGFYRDILPVDPAERERWKQIAFNEASILAASGAPKLAGESDYTAVERLWIRPTAEINGITAGYQGEGSKTIVPRKASAKLSFRLVPGQKPEMVAEQVRDYFHALCPDTVRLRVEYDHGGEPFYADPSSEISRAAQAALTAIFGQPPALTREGLSIPIVSLLHRTLGHAPLLVGLGLPDCQAHSPNETFPLEQMERGIRFHGELLRHWAHTARLGLY